MIVSSNDKQFLRNLCTIPNNDLIGWRQRFAECARQTADHSRMWPNKEAVQWEHRIYSNRRFDLSCAQCDVIRRYNFSVHPKLVWYNASSISCLLAYSSCFVSVRFPYLSMWVPISNCYTILIYFFSSNIGVNKNQSNAKAHTIYSGSEQFYAISITLSFTAEPRLLNNHNQPTNHYKDATKELSRLMKRESRLTQPRHSASRSLMRT